MEILHSLIIGIVQGITEFLPISSSAHLVLTPYIFNWNYEGLKFDTALHFGTMVAILVFFWRDWVLIIKNALFRESGRQRPNKGKVILSVSEESSEAMRLDSLDPSAMPQGDNTNYPKNLLWQIIIATIPAGIVGYLIQDYVEAKFHSPLLLAVNLAVFGLILWLVDKYSKSNNRLSAIGYLQSFIVGIFQSFALIPGISRSGITMVASRGLGLKRETAARFSFLLGTPAMAGAFLLEARKLTSADLNMTFLIGVIASAITGFFAIKFLLQYLQKSDFKVFTIYRFILAAIIIILVLKR